MIRNGYHWFKLEKRRAEYNTVNGAPQLIIKALERHYATRIGGGGMKVALGTTTIGLRAGLDGGGFGTGAIAGLVISSVTALGQMLDRVPERIFLRRVFSQAKKFNKQGSKLRDDYDAFCYWFQGWLLASPVLAALVLHVNYAQGDHALDFMSISGGNRSEITHMGKLRKHATRYLLQHRDEYSPAFDSDIELLKNKVQEAYTKPK